MLDARQLEASIWRITDGLGTDDDLARLHHDERASLYILERLIAETDDDIARARPVSYTHLRAHETVLDLVCRLLLEKKKQASR